MLSLREGNWRRNYKVGMNVKTINKIIIPELICLCCSPLIFVAMYLDYFYQVSNFYFIAIIVPIFFLRRYIHLMLLFILSCTVSSLLVHIYIPITENFFKPFDQTLAVLVVIEAVIFGILQVLLLRLMKFLWKGKNSS